MSEGRRCGSSCREQTCPPLPVCCMQALTDEKVPIRIGEGHLYSVYATPLWKRLPDTPRQNILTATWPSLAQSC